MKQKNHWITWLVVAAGVLLTACGGSTTAEPAAPTAAPAAPTTAPAAAPDSGQVFVVDSAASSATYIVQEEFFAGAFDKLGINAGRAEVNGVSQEVSGQLVLNLADPEDVLGENRFVVDLTGLKTDQSRRDEWIQDNGPAFSSFPLAEFVATEIQTFSPEVAEGETISFKLVGDLTIRGVTQEVVFDVTASVMEKTITGTAVADLKMTDFGIEPPSFANTLTVQDDFQVRIDLVAHAE